MELIAVIDADLSAGDGRLPTDPDETGRQLGEGTPHLGGKGAAWRTPRGDVRAQELPART